MDESDNQQTVSAPGNATPALLRENLALLAELVDQLTRLDNHLFAEECAAIGGGQTVGRHCRHICDHYDALLSSVEQDNLMSSVDVDYDKRARSTETERSRDLCIERLQGFRRRLADLDDVDGERPIRLSVEVFIGGKGTTTMVTSFARELAFLASHTTHHSALVALLLRSANQEPAEDLGRAAATRAHESASA
ncbi:MAG: DinB family protein [Pseudomonadota bacterium]